MKKIIVFVLALVMCLSFASCGKKDNNSGNDEGGKDSGNEVKLDQEIAAKWAGFAKGKDVYLTTVGQSDMDLVKSILNKVGSTVVDQYTWSSTQTSAPASCTATTHVGCYEKLEANNCNKGSIVLLVTGTSNKGLGTAGVSVQSETTRATAFASAAQAGDITLIVLHIGGADRRGSLTDPILNVVCPQADLMLVVNDGNSDNYFTNSASVNSVELSLYSTKAKVGTAFSKLFN